jgi:PhzF family phenazine biosynthesis protein
VDVFGERALTGNPLAVVVDADGLTTDEMVELTQWLNFSETTFLTPPESPQADYRVRIFTLSGEIPFAGHPTLGTCHVWASLGEDPGAEIVQECGVGLVRLRRSGDGVFFEAPDLIRDGPIAPGDLDDIVSILGVREADVVASRWVDNGPGWVGVLLRDAKTVLGLRPDLSRRAGDGPVDIGVAGFHDEGRGALYEVRAFFSNQRGELVEDPVTGSLNASMAQWLIGEGRATAPYVATQGAGLGRSGRIEIVTDEDGSIWVGGRVCDVVSGSL